MTRLQSRRHRDAGAEAATRPGPVRVVVDEVEHLHQIEHDGVSEATPWIAIAGLAVLLAAVGLLVYGIVEGAAALLASASPMGT